MPPIDWNRPQEFATVVCRPALPKDTPAVVELAKHIWEGEDYIPHVWEDWLADTEGLFVVAEYGGRLAGLNKLSCLSPDDWWLEGLRVHPDFQGRGIASHLHDFLLAWWERNAGGVIRLITASYRMPVHHLCERTSFRKIGETTPYVASPTADHSESFLPLTSNDVPAAAEFIKLNSGFSMAAGLINLGWELARPTREHIAHAIQRGQAWWWGEREAMLLTMDDDEENGDTMMIQLITCPLESMSNCLLEARRLVAELGYQRISWHAPLDAGFESHLQAAGFQRDWDQSLYIYEKSHPGRPHRSDRPVV
jgi:GNAT superfamily N-acetyltransferase